MMKENGKVPNRKMGSKRYPTWARHTAKMTNPLVRTLFKKTLILMVALTLLTVLSMCPVQSTQGLPSEASVDSTYTTLTASVDLGRVIGTNKLALGTQITGYDGFQRKPTLQQKAKAAGLKMVRVFVAKDKCTQPCESWNEASSTGYFDWSHLDPLVKSIYSIGAEPLLNLANAPPGMSQNYMGTGFPNPRSFGAYAAAIMRHLKSIGKNVKYWEILRTPEIRNSAGLIDSRRVLRYTNFFNGVQGYMHGVDSNALVASDRTFYQAFFNVFVSNARGVGFLTYMKYDASGLPNYRPQGYTSGDRAMQLAGVLDRPTSGAWAVYSPKEEQRRWLSVRGQVLPVIADEVDLNSVYGGGTDPRIRMPLGGAHYAQELRSFILDGTVRYSIYYRYCDMGMIKSTYPYTQWYPYWANYLFGANLRVGNSLFYTYTQSSLVSLLAWGNSTHYFVVVIGRTSGTYSVSLQISNGQINRAAPIRVYSLDKQWAFGPLSRAITYTNPVRLNAVGYSVNLVVIRRSA